MAKMKVEKFKWKSGKKEQEWEANTTKKYIYDIKAFRLQ